MKISVFLKYLIDGLWTRERENSHNFFPANQRLVDTKILVELQLVLMDLTGTLNQIDQFETILNLGSSDYTMQSTSINIFHGL